MSDMNNMPGHQLRNETSPFNPEPWRAQAAERILADREAQWNALSQPGAQFHRGTASLGDPASADDDGSIIGDLLRLKALAVLIPMALAAHYLQLWSRFQAATGFAFVVAVLCLSHAARRLLIRAIYAAVGIVFVAILVSGIFFGKWPIGQ